MNLFSQYSAIGYDMDHTLIQYNLDELYPLVHNAMKSCLVDVLSHNASCPILSKEYDATFCRKGLIFDTSTGDFLQLDKFGRVRTARHGRGPMMTAEDIDHRYHRHDDDDGLGRRSKWQHYDDLVNAKRCKEDYVSFITDFDVPVAFLLAGLVDMQDLATAGLKKGDNNGKDDVRGVVKDNDGYEAPVRDLFSCFGHCYEPVALRLNRGDFFPSLKADPMKYLHSDKDGKVRSLLASHKCSFLLTNSAYDFTDLLMTAVHGNSWRSLFAFVFVSCGKPGFFGRRSSNRNGEGDNSASKGHTIPPPKVLHEANGELCEVLEGGCVDDVHARLWALHDDGNGNNNEDGDNDQDFHRDNNANAENVMRFLYVGDHMQGDVLALGDLDQWDAVAIVGDDIAPGGGGGNWWPPGPLADFGGVVSNGNECEMPITPSHWGNLVERHSVRCVGLVEELI